MNWYCGKGFVLKDISIGNAGIYHVQQLLDQAEVELEKHQLQVVPEEGLHHCVSLLVNLVVFL